MSSLLLRFRTWLHAHRTRLIGYLAMLLSTVQMNFDQVRELIPEKHRPVILFFFGLVVASVGWYNSQRELSDDGTVTINSP